MSDVSAPQVRVIWPPEDSLTPADSFDIIGVCFDSSGIQSVEVTLTIPTFGQVTENEQQPYQPAQQFRPGDWSIWSARVTVSERRFSRIVARAKDGAGNFGYYDKFIIYPEPPPPPPPPTFRHLVGVNWYSQVLRNKTSSVNVASIANRAKRLGTDKVNFIRLPFSMDAFEFNKVRAIQEINTIATECKKYGIFVQLDLHQHDAEPGNGDFPSQYMSGYTCSTMYRWWQEFLQNRIPGFWNAIASMWEAIIADTKQNDNIIGYELLNEPKFPPLGNGLASNEAVFRAYGNFYDYVAKRIRAKDAGRYIMLCEGNQTKASVRKSDGTLDCNQGANGIPGDDPRYEPLIFPMVSKMAYDFHRYRLIDTAGGRPKAGPLLEDIQRVKNLEVAVRARGIEIIGSMCQEYAVGTPSGGFLGSPNSLESMLIFMTAFEAHGVGSAYWAAFGPGQDGRELYKQSTTDPSGWEPNNSGGLIWDPNHRDSTGALKPQYVADAGGEGTYFLQARRLTYGY